MNSQRKREKLKKNEEHIILHGSTSEHDSSVPLQHELYSVSGAESFDRVTQGKSACASVRFLYLTHPGQECESYFIKSPAVHVEELC